jgi:NMD protein affecting ribosome stability and mRNA decay
MVHTCHVCQDPQYDTERQDCGHWACDDCCYALVDRQTATQTRTTRSYCNHCGDYAVGHSWRDAPD